MPQQWPAWDTKTFSFVLHRNYVYYIFIYKILHMSILLDENKALQNF